MRTVLVNILAACSSFVTLLAGQLDVAVIQFPEEKNPTELQSAFATVDLFELTDADRTRSSNAYLKGGYVLFAQRLRAVPGSSFSTATRLKNSSASVTGRLDHASTALSISLVEGIKAGLRAFGKKVYTGSGPLPPGHPMFSVFAKCADVLPASSRSRREYRAIFLLRWLSRNMLPKPKTYPCRDVHFSGRVRHDG